MNCLLSHVITQAYAGTTDDLPMDVFVDLLFEDNPSYENDGCPKDIGFDQVQRAATGTVHADQAELSLLRL